eukprot:3263970-Rhodomonas_salina.1
MLSTRALKQAVRARAAEGKIALGETIKGELEDSSDAVVFIAAKMGACSACSPPRLGKNNEGEEEGRVCDLDAVSGTEPPLVLRAVRYHLTVLLRTRYALSGTDIVPAYCAATHSLRVVQYRHSNRPIELLHAHCALSRIGVGYAATHLLRAVQYWSRLSCYAPATRCPVPTKAMLLPGVREGGGDAADLCRRCAAVYGGSAAVYGGSAA